MSTTAKKILYTIADPYNYIFLNIAKIPSLPSLLQDKQTQAILFLLAVKRLYLRLFL